MTGKTSPISNESVWQRIRVPALYVVSIAAGLLIWQLIAQQFEAFVLAPPSAVLARLVASTLDGSLPLAVAASARHALLGLLIATALAVPLGMLIGRRPFLYDLLNPLFTVIYSVPPIAWVPVIIVWFGLFFEARVAVVVLMVFFDMLFIVIEGVRNVDRQLISVGRSFGAGRWALARLVLIPATLPFLFAALRAGIIRAVNAMVTAELFLASINLGAIMTQASAHFDSATVLAVILVLSLLGLVLQEIVLLAERRICKWIPR